MSVIEKYRYRGKATKNGLYQGSDWEYFDAYSDPDAKVEFRLLTGLSAANGDNVQIQAWDSDYKFWTDID